MLIGKAEYRRYTFNDVILAQGAVGEALFIITDGEVRVECSDTKGTWQLARLGSGAVFGEMSMLDRSGATANVVADGQVEILTVSGPELEHWRRRTWASPRGFTDPWPPRCPGVCAPLTKLYAADKFADQIHVV